MLYIIGLGLSDVEDITYKGLKAVRASDLVYLEHYTSILGGGVEYVRELETFYGKQVVLADRNMVEQESDRIIESARHQVVSFLVVGDPFGATTHTDLVLRAREKGIPYKIIHNASILNAVGCCGLQLYEFGETISICFWSEGWRPSSYLDKAAENRRRGLHTLCLLDIKVKEKSVENLIRGRDIYEPPRYMSCAQACAQILEIIAEEKENKTVQEKDDNDNDEEANDRRDRKISTVVNSNSGVIEPSTLCVGLARVGRDDQEIRVDTLANMAECDLGKPLHSLIIVGRVHPMEADYLRIFYQNEATTPFDNLIHTNNKIFV